MPTLKPCKATPSTTRCNTSPRQRDAYPVQHPKFDKSNSRMAVCNTVNLDMLGCLISTPINPDSQSSAFFSGGHSTYQVWTSLGALIDCCFSLFNSK